MVAMDSVCWSNLADGVRDFDGLVSKGFCTYYCKGVEDLDSLGS